ncbi:MAG TPA: hypothetical protein VIN59_04985 [Alphaproteobacteria bacterium]
MKKKFASQVHGKAQELFEATGAVMGKVATNIEATFDAFACLAKGDVAGFQRSIPEAIKKVVEVGKRMLGIPFAHAAETADEKLRLMQAKRRGPSARIGPPKSVLT